MKFYAETVHYMKFYAETVQVNYETHYNYPISVSTVINTVCCPWGAGSRAFVTYHTHNAP